MRSAAVAIAFASMGLAACSDKSSPSDEARAAPQAVIGDLPAAQSPDTSTKRDATVSATPTPLGRQTDLAAANSDAEPKKALGVSPGDGRIAAQERHEKYEALGEVNKAVFDELRKPAPDLTVVRRNSIAIRDYSEQMANWFPAGSGPHDGIKTDAKPSVWSDRAGFKLAVERMVAQSHAFVRTAEGDDLDAIRSASRILGAGCKNCHDQFRVEDD